MKVINSFISEPNYQIQLVNFKNLKFRYKWECKINHCEFRISIKKELNNFFLEKIIENDNILFLNQVLLENKKGIYINDKNEKFVYKYVEIIIIVW